MKPRHAISEPQTAPWSKAGDPKNFDAPTFDIMQHVATAARPITTEADLRLAWILLSSECEGVA